MKSIMIKNNYWLLKVGIKVQTIENNNSPGEIHFIPRIRFRFTLPFGDSY
jgi:hypothetical protein